MSAKESPGFDRDIDWALIGLPDHSPFAILSRPKAAPKPPKQKPKQPGRTHRERTLAALEDPRKDKFNTHIPTRKESDRTLGIKGHVS